ncbi:unnamed protein product, partial [Didymodactylos carnosus]
VAGISGSMDCNSSQLSYPNDAANDSCLAVYGAGTNNQRIQRWLAGATTCVTIAGINMTIGSNSSTKFNYPRAIFVDSNNTLCVSDAYNYRIQMFSYNSTTGVTAAEGNGAGSSYNQINVSYGVYVDTSGTIYHSDYSNNRVMK